MQLIKLQIFCVSQQILIVIKLLVLYFPNMDDQNDDTFFAKYLTKNEQLQQNQNKYLQQTDNNISQLCKQAEQLQNVFAQLPMQKLDNIKSQKYCQALECSYQKDMSNSIHKNESIQRNSKQQNYKQCLNDQKSLMDSQNQEQSQISQEDGNENADEQRNFQLLCQKYQQRNLNLQILGPDSQNSNQKCMQSSIQSSIQNSIQNSNSLKSNMKQSILNQNNNCIQGSIKNSSIQSSNKHSINNSKVNSIQNSNSNTNSIKHSNYHNSIKHSNYQARNQLQKHLTLSDSHLKQIQSVLQKSQPKDRQLFKTISFNGDKDQRLVIMNSLRKHQIDDYIIQKNTQNDKQSTQSKFQYDVIQSENSQDQLKQKLNRNCIFSTERHKQNIGLEKQLIHSQNMQKKLKHIQTGKGSEFTDFDNIETDSKKQNPMSHSTHPKERFSKQKSNEIQNKALKVIQKQQTLCHNNNNIQSREDKITDSKSHPKNSLIQKDSFNNNNSAYHIQNKVQAELIQKVANLQKIINSLKKFKQNKEVLQIQSNQSKSVTPTIDKMLFPVTLPSNVQSNQIKQTYYKQKQQKHNQLIIKKQRSNHHKTKEHYKKTSEISCRSQQTSKTSNFQRQSSKRPKGNSLLTQIKLLKAKVEHLQQQKRLRAIGVETKNKTKRERTRKKTASYSQTYLLAHEQSNHKLSCRNNLPCEQYYNNQTLKYQKKSNAENDIISDRRVFYNNQSPKINVDFKDLFENDHQIQDNLNLDKSNNSSNVMKRQINHLYKSIISMLPNCPKVSDGKKKLFNRAMKWYKSFLPQNLEVQSMVITKFDKYVHFRTNLLNYDILWYFNGKFYCGDTLQAKSLQKNIKQSNTVLTIYKQGQGTQIIPNKCVYQGRFENDKKEGYGVTNFKNGSTYEGTWQNNQMSGRGTFNSAEGDIYEGQVKHNLKQGVGKQLFMNGDKYKGEYSKGVFEGKGKYKWFNGSSYKGQFKNGLLNGSGTWKSGFGDKYQGEYHDNLKHGFGIYQWKTGTVYKGYFFNGVKIGQQQGKFQFISNKNHQDKAQNQIKTKNGNRKGISTYRSQQKYKYG